jgi:hypothetical protein
VTHSKFARLALMFALGFHVYEAGVAIGALLALDGERTRAQVAPPPTPEELAARRDAWEHEHRQERLDALLRDFTDAGLVDAIAFATRQPRPPHP